MSKACDYAGFSSVSISCSRNSPKSLHICRNLLIWAFPEFRQNKQDELHYNLFIEANDLPKGTVIRQDPPAGTKG
ncbi:hypothetical protein BC351_23340 [Paenibacillus ferrarius]|uniref:Uncharacterized protein n=1 Tax=Paenibacillus ferrarius TaxID=1469647 RepID=A0A1V4HMG0_9BACL|nr:hypothetical protein BC351_23340 [Paenibacillus ferrarius]